MLERLQSILEPIRMRQQMDRGLNWAIYGLLVGAVTGSVLLIAASWGEPTSRAPAWIIFLALPVVAGFAGLLLPQNWQSSARLVDRKCELKDRTVTALDFVTRADRKPVHDLQLSDAIDHLEKIDPDEVVPLEWPRHLSTAAIATCVMLLLGILSFMNPGVASGVTTEPLDVVLEQAELLETTMLEDVEELAEELEDPELQELVDELKRSVKEMKEPQVDQREALAQLSEMQAVLQQTLKQMNVQQVDAQLQQLAAAIQISDATQAASQALREAKYDKAAKELEKLEMSSMKRKEQDALSENLAKMNRSLGKGTKGQLGGAVQEMLDGLGSDDDTKYKSGVKKAASVCRRQRLRKKISNCLNCQVNRLCQCKNACKTSTICQSTDAKKSDRPSTSAGRGVSNNPFGKEKTKLDSERRSESVTGISGDGPSERETTSVDEAEQDAARTYRERYAEFRKQMEEVIDSEPLPLGHRETVKRYFESIRPTSSDSEVITEENAQVSE